MRRDLAYVSPPLGEGQPVSRAALFNRRAARQNPETRRVVNGEHPTEPPELPQKSIARAAGLRRVMTAVLFAFVVAGGLAFFGMRDDTVTSTGAGYTLTVDHATVTRPGLETPWTAHIKKAGGFSGTVQLRTDAAYFDMFDVNEFDTQPDTTRRDGKYEVMEFQQPVGEELVVALDGRLSPSTQSGLSATTTLLVDGVKVTQVKYRTRVMP